jgi:Domain of unknown function (DUF4166)/Saccharopine dehydrogenase NADP binding domain
MTNQIEGHSLKILILGGYGVFGGRLVHLLSDLPQLTLVICGRSRAKAEAFCADYAGSAKAVSLVLDRRDIASALVEQQPDLVVDASGPFQDYGNDRYQIIEACIEAGVNYVDFADAADFVFGVSQFDERARQAGVFVLSGVSSFPVLTAAVLREMAGSMDIVSVEGGIAPSPYAGIGLNVMRAVVGYAGAPVKLTREGKKGHGIGLAESRRYTVAVPGELPLRNLRFSLVDVPDLQVLPAEHPTLADIWMGAGPVPESLHRLLNVLAKARAKLGLPTFEPFSRLFYIVLNSMKFGEHRGGMYVHARGLRAGLTVERSWHLLAEGDDGPFIPSMAIEAIVRKLLRGEVPSAGARAATHALDLADYDELFAGRTIKSGFRDEGQGGPIYRQVLGSTFDSLPPLIRQLHDSSSPRNWVGKADVTRGKRLVARLIANIVGFPKSGNDVPVTVTFSPENDGELWTRSFGNRRFSSFQASGKGRSRHLLVERFGIATFALALVVENGCLTLIPRSWSVLGIPMPSFLLPRGNSFETEREGEFRFDVTIAVPWIGMIVAYRGALSPG